MELAQERATPLIPDDATFWSSIKNRGETMWALENPSLPVSVFSFDFCDHGLQDSFKTKRSALLARASGL